MDEQEKILFSESQRLSLLLIAPLIILFLGGIFLVGQIVFRPALETDDPWPQWALTIAIGGIVINVLVTLILTFARLQIRLNPSGLHIKLFPLHFKYKKIILDDISSVYVLVLEPSGELGGWSLRMGSGMVYNVSGNKGVQLELKNGKKMVIGSQNAYKFAEILQEAMFHARVSPYALPELEPDIPVADQPLEQAG